MLALVRRGHPLLREASVFHALLGATHHLLDPQAVYHVWLRPESFVTESWDRPGKEFIYPLLSFLIIFSLTRPLAVELVPI